MNQATAPQLSPGSRHAVLQGTPSGVPLGPQYGFQPVDQHATPRPLGRQRLCRVGLVRTPAELQAVGRLRYEVYVRQLARDEGFADHVREEVLEPLDAAGAVFVAFEGDRAVGTVRQNFIADPAAAEHRALYGLPGDSDPREVVTTKLIVADRSRGSRLALELACAAYEWAVERRAPRAWLDCNAPMRRFFERLGYLPVRSVRHPLYGEVTVMQLQPFDAAHLAALDSPFLPILQRHQP